MIYKYLIAMNNCKYIMYFYLNQTIKTFSFGSIFFKDLKIAWLNSVGPEIQTFF